MLPPSRRPDRLLRLAQSRAVCCHRSRRSGGSGGPFNPKNSCFSYFQDVSIINNSLMSNYNGLQVTLNGRNYHGLSFITGYTYSHALADASDEGRASDLSVPLNNYASIRSQLYMPTNYDLRHRATFSVTYALPGRPGLARCSKDGR